jgi:hypothetical protein
MALPELIPVKYTEEEAKFLSVRPVVRQSFRPYELLDMILGVTGKDAARVQQVLRSGTVVFHFYRYWWEGLEVSASELAAPLAAFPDADPARPFCIEECTAVLLDTGSQIPAQWTRQEASRRRWLRRSNFWEVLMAVAAAASPHYERYAYDRKSDVYSLPLGGARKDRLARAATALLPAAQRGPLAVLPRATRLLLFCPRAA